MSNLELNPLWNNTPVLVECICGDTTLVPSLKKLDEWVHMKWKKTQDLWKDKDGNVPNEYKDALVTAGIYNKPEKMLKVFQDDGFVKIMCASCMTFIQMKFYQDNHIDVVRIGNMVFDKAYFESDRRNIQNQLTNYEPSFWC